MWKSTLQHNGAKCRTKKSRELNQRRSVWRCLAMFVALDSACQPLHLQFFPDSVQLIFNILTSSEFAITASRQYWWHIRWHRPCCNVWCWIAIDCERLFHILVGCCNFSSRQFLGTPLLRFAPVDSQHLAPGIDRFKTKKKWCRNWAHEAWNPRKWIWKSTRWTSAKSQKPPELPKTSYTLFHNEAIVASIGRVATGECDGVRFLKVKKKIVKHASSILPGLRDHFVLKHRHLDDHLLCPKLTKTLQCNQFITGDHQKTEGSCHWFFVGHVLATVNQKFKRNKQKIHVLL